MEIKLGTRLGPYEIVSSIGKGGMGEVWRARDSRLNRDVAIKVSAQQFTDRFEREANAPASLNHSNICALFDVGPARLWPTRSRPTENQPRSLSRKLSVKESVTAPKREHEAIFLQSFVGEMLRRAPVGE
jgi:serine/threonine protein kinase